MSWRQFRTQALIGAIGLAAFAVYLVILGGQVHHGYHDSLALCHRQGGGCDSALTAFKERFEPRILFLDAIMVLVPALIGLFWGAPLVTRELETGTHRLVWSQSVTRRRWLAVKLLFVGLAGMLLTTLASLLLTWAAGPYDKVEGDQFSTALFGTRNVVPIAYAAFAFVLAVVIGIVVRRTVAAMGLTFLLFVVVQVLVPNVVRPHLMTPVSATQPLTADVIQNLSMIGRRPVIAGLKVPGVWVVSSSGILTASGRPVSDAAYGTCTNGAFDKVADCLGKLNLHVEIEYQPADRYWTFQWIESAIFAGLALLLAALGLWRIRGRLTS